MISRPTPRAAGRPVLLGLLLAAALVLAPSAATAHDVLVESSPEDGATVAVPPEDVLLTFSADQLDLGAQVSVVDPAGQERATGGAEVSGAVVRQRLDGSGTAGAWTVTWRSVANDGHPVTGELTFTVQEGSATVQEGSAGNGTGQDPDQGGPLPEDGAGTESTLDEQDPPAEPVAPDGEPVGPGETDTDDQEGPGPAMIALLALGGIAAVLTVLALLRRGGPFGRDA